MNNFIRKRLFKNNDDKTCNSYSAYYAVRIVKLLYTNCEKNV